MKDNDILKDSGNGARPLLVAGAQKRRPGGDNGKRKPIVDDEGLKWCACTKPKLVSNMGIGPGVAHCLKCGCNWYR